MVIRRIHHAFTEHPKKAGETYFEHGKFASKAGLRLVYAGVSCLLHSVFPFLHKTTASDIVMMMNETMEKRNSVERLEPFDENQAQQDSSIPQN